MINHEMETQVPCMIEDNRKELIKEMKEVSTFLPYIHVCVCILIILIIFLLYFLEIMSVSGFFSNITSYNFLNFFEYRKQSRSKTR